jgi:hypothetical protein
MLVLFLPPPSPLANNFWKKKKFDQGISKKKLSTQAKNFEKIIVQVGNGIPPITFLMVRPLGSLAKKNCQFFAVHLSK